MLEGNTQVAFGGLQEGGWEFQKMLAAIHIRTPESAEPCRGVYCPCRTPPGPSTNMPIRVLTLTKPGPAPGPMERPRLITGAFIFPILNCVAVNLAVKL